jgi:hypothetical protein
LSEGNKLQSLNSTQAHCLSYSRSPRALRNNRPIGYVFGVSGEVYCTLANVVAFRNVVITSGHAAKRQSDVRFALICHFKVKLALGSVGLCDLAQCRTVRSGEQVGYLRASHLLAKHPPLISPHGSPSQSGYSIAFEATLVGHCYVKLENSRVLTQAERSIACRSGSCACLSPRPGM